MERIWLQQYPEGIPAEIDLGAFASLKDLIEDTCRRFGDRPAFGNMGASLTFRELERESRAFGAYLQHVPRLRRGDRVAIMMPNLLQYPVALLGALRAGFTVVNVNPQYTPRELEYQLADSGAAAVVVLENFAGRLQQVLPRTQVRAVLSTKVGDLLPVPRRWLVNLAVRHVKRMVPPWRIEGAVDLPAALREGRRRALDEVSLARDDLAFLQYTGGTTGVAKGAMLTHGNLLANVMQMAAWLASHLKDGEETAVIPLPLYHVYALTSALVFFKIGAHSLLITDPRRMRDFVATLRRSRFTAIVGVNTLYAALLDAPGFDRVDLSHLKVISAGGMAVQRTVAHRWKQASGRPVIEGYGLTEASPVAIANPPGIEEWTGAIGLPIPSTDAAILDEEGRELPQGEVGEIAVRGPQVMPGYWKRPEETAKVFTRDGWLRTGDMGSMDERGWIRLTDRKKDVIVVSGFKVFPNEVEDVVAMHPGVLEVAAIGAPDGRSGEQVKIVVVRRDPALTERELIEHCKVHLARYKVPRVVEFRDRPLPKTNVGKILRRELRAPASV